MPKIKTIRDDILTENEISETLIECKREDVRAAGALMWMTGCRVGELVLLKLKDFVDKEKFVEINMPTLKQRKPVMPRRRILIPKSTQFYKFLKDHINSLHPKYDDMLVFECSPYTIWNVLKRANPYIYPHLFRHSRATIMSENVDVFDLKYAFGWADMQMPARYVHRKNSPERILDALEKEGNAKE